MSLDAVGGRGGSAPRRPVVTVAAKYGAGGSVVGPRVAERLGVEFLDFADFRGFLERNGGRVDIPAHIVDLDASKPVPF